MTDLPFEIPIAWLWAEFVADTLVTTSRFRWTPSAPEFRAVRDVLALSLLCSGIAHEGVPMTDADLRFLADCVSEEGLWVLWCRSNLDNRRLLTGTANRRLAYATWEWLANSRITPQPGGLVEVPSQSCCRFGLGQARHVIALHLLT